MYLTKREDIIGSEKVSDTCVCVLSSSVVSDSLQPQGLQPTRLSVHGILQARILEWVAMPSSRGSSQPRDQTAPPALQADPLPLSHRGSPCICVHFTKSHKAKSLNGLGEWPVQPVVLGYRRLLNACHGFHLTTNLRSVYFFLKSFIYLLWLCWVVVAM